MTVRIFIVLFFNPFFMSGQQVVEIVLEDELLIFPDKLLIRLNIINNKRSNQVLKEFQLLNTKEVVKELSEINQIKVVDSKSSEENDFFNFVYLEVFDKETFLKLQTNILRKVPYIIQKIEVYNFDEYEDKLEKVFLEESKKVLQKKGLKLLNLISIEILKEKGKPEEHHFVDKEKMNFHDILKQPFVELNYKGFSLNRNKEIVFNKKVKIKLLAGKI